MIASRTHTPNEGQVLYHYCSSATFLALCQGKKLRYSDVAQMNDFMERQWGTQILGRVLGNLEHDLTAKFCEVLWSNVEGLGHIAKTLACCLSLEGDVLSQWRAYAEDGTGFAVGFDAPTLQNLPGRMLRVAYAPAIQELELAEHVRALHSKHKDAPDSGDARFDSAHLAYDMCAYKNPAFREEQEVRLVHVVGYEQEGGGFRLVAPEAHGAPVRFNMKKNIPVPYLDLDFTLGGTQSPIREVIIGPRNGTAELDALVMLTTLGVHNVSVKKSEASYR